MKGRGTESRRLACQFFQFGIKQARISVDATVARRSNFGCGFQGDKETGRKAKRILFTCNLFCCDEMQLVAENISRRHGMMLKRNDECVRALIIGEVRCGLR